MKLTRNEFERRYAQGTLKLALVGMSNIGKSYSGMRLATDYDFTLIEVDKLIWTRLGETDMDAFARWQGQPYSDGYAERERESLVLESDATQESLETDARNPLLDTTGSVIYTDAAVRDAIRTDWFVVYIKAADDHLERLKALYFAQPKPLVWDGHYRRVDGLSEDESLLECYPKLLDARHAAYTAMADHVIGSDEILTSDTVALFDRIKPTG